MNRWRMVASLAAAGLLSMAAIGQPERGFGGFRGGEDQYAPPVSSRDMDRYADMLGLDQEQRALAEALFEGYMEQFQAEARQVREQTDQLRARAEQEGNREGWREMGQIMQRFGERRGEMEQSFLADVRSLLTAEQAERWPKVERARRRENTLRMGRVSGEAVDLIRLVDEAELDEATNRDLAPILERYELDLDRALVKRNEIYESARERMREAMESGDREGIQDLFEEGRDAGVRIRDLNARYARQVEAMLPEQARSAFADAVKRASFPQVYRATYADRVFEAVDQMRSLSEDQRSAIASLRERYRREVGSINDEMCRAIAAQEEDASMGQMFRGPRGGEDDAASGLRQRKRDLDQGTVESLRKVLTPEQATQLPEDDRPQRMRGAPGGPDEGGPPMQGPGGRGGRGGGRGG